MSSRFCLAICFAAALVPSVLSSQAVANDGGWTLPGTISGTATAASDYRFRGISQTDENPAIQGSLTYTFPINDSFNLYTGAWASNVDFNDGDEAQVEIDIAAGIAASFDKLTLDLGWLGYYYPGADSSLNYDYIEWQALAGYDFGLFLLRAGVNYTPENFGDSGDAAYAKLAVDVPLPHSLKFSSRVGRQIIDDEAAFGYPDYTDWAAGLTYQALGLDFMAEYVDTNIDKNDCADGCDATVIFSVTKAF